MKITEELLRKHSLGICTEEEKTAVEKWLGSSEEETIALRTTKDLDVNEEKAWERIAQNAPELGDRWSLEKAKNVILFNHLTRYAAAAVVLLTIGFFSYHSLSDNFTADGTEQSLALKTINTQRGEKRTVILSDGSTIRMNYQTEIRVPEKFEGSERVVYLTGHAHFDVARDTERPFIIYTKDSKTQVLGTSFEINTKEEGATEIIVTSGKVAFSEKDKVNNLVTLTLNDRAVLGADRIIKTDEVDAQRLTAWRENKLLFDGETLAEIIEVLEPWYDIEIMVESEELLKEDFILSLDNPPLSSVLEDLSFASGLEYKIKGKQVIIF